ncbi:hypothetical protein N0V86_004740 [Didymella sp. IMI 355093]|nr:hypothetical protein N0V86_004740 [Didymella sp. IMI 355093]
MSKRPTLFPALAIMSAVMRATMLLPVATAIGQLKWSWFRSSRRLIDMERFDEAARGILGSAKLMFYLRFRNLAAIGAALTILALPLDAVIQSAVLMPSSVETVSSLKARSYEFDDYQTTTNFSRATSYTKYYQMTSSDDVFPDLAMMNAIQWGQSYSNGPSYLVGAPVNVDCPTGYCVFNTTQTLGIGRSCVRRTDIRYVPPDGIYAPYQTLPGTDIEFYFNGHEGLEKEWIVAATYTGYPTNSYEKDVFGMKHGPLIVRTSMMYNPGSTADADVDFGTIAIECALYWTIQTYTIYINETTDYEYYENSDDSITFSMRLDEDSRWVLEPSRCIVNGEQVPGRNDTKYDEIYYRDNCVYWVGKESHLALQKILTDSDYGLVGNIIDWLRLAFLTRKEYAWRRSALPLLFHGLEDQERLAQGDVRDFNVMQDLAKDIRVRLTEHVDANGARLTTVS